MITAPNTGASILRAELRRMEKLCNTSSLASRFRMLLLNHSKAMFETLSFEEKQRVLAVMHENRFVDKAPAEIHAQLLNEDVCLCSVATMYRILRENAEVPKT